MNWTGNILSFFRQSTWIDQLIPFVLEHYRSGIADGLTYEEIESLYPEEFGERDKDKYNFRYIRGESYRDLVQRLEPVIMELERHREPGHSIFIIGHQAVLRCIYAYFMNYSPEELPYIKVPLHTIVKLTPKAYECHEERFPVDIPAVDTHRAKPTTEESLLPLSKNPSHHYQPKHLVSLLKKTHLNELRSKSVVEHEVSDSNASLS